MMQLQGGQRVGGDFHSCAAILAAEFSQQLCRQQGNIFFPFAQWRDVKRNHVQTVKKIFAEISFGDFFFQIFIGGGNQTHIDANGLGSADGGELLLVERAQHLGLGLQAHIANFVEE